MGEGQKGFAGLELDGSARQDVEAGGFEGQGGADQRVGELVRAMPGGASVFAEVL